MAFFSFRTALVCLVVGVASSAHASQVTWRFDNLAQVGGFSAEADGAPTVIRAPVGRALQFDGVDDSLLIEGRPLVGAKTFTIEAIFRPDGGVTEQRFMHIAETDPATGLDAQPDAPGGDPNARFMFEIRVVGDNWYLDAFVNGKSGYQPLMAPQKLHKLGRWYAVAQTYDGKTYRSYVDGVLQTEALVAFTPQGPGHVRVGARMNKVSYFHGALARARFTDHALRPSQLLKAPQ